MLGLTCDIHNTVKTGVDLFDWQVCAANALEIHLHNVGVWSAELSLIYTQSIHLSST